MASRFGICLTGHRPDRLRGYDLRNPYYVEMQSALEALIDESVEAHGALDLHSGLALGADAVWTEAVIARRAALEEDLVRLVVHVPNEEQANRWKEADQEKWRQFRDEADEEIVYGERYSFQSMHARNRGMVDRSSLVVAVWNGTESGGTFTTVQYARRKGKDIIVMDPEDLSMKAWYRSVVE